MDINRNVGVRDVCLDDNGPSPSQPFAKLFQYKSLPNIAFGDYEIMSPKIRQTDTTFYYRASSSEPNNNYISNPCIVMEKTLNNCEAPVVVEPPEEECAVSGRLEIRVMSKEQMALKEPSPNPEESIYFDAVVTNNGPTTIDEEQSKPIDEKKENVQYEEEFIWLKKEPQEKKYDIKVYEDSLKIQKYKIVTVDKSDDDMLDGPDDKNANSKEKICEVPEIIRDIIEENPDDEIKIVEEGAHALMPCRQPDDIESTTDNRIDVERMRDCSSSSNSKIPVFNPGNSSRMLSQRSSWAGIEDPDISDLTPGMYKVSLRH